MPSFIYNGNIIEYSLTRNAKKNVNFRIKGDGTVCISAPKRISNKELQNMIKDKAEWIITNQNNIMQKQHNSIDKKITSGSYMILNGNKYIIRIISGKENSVYFHEKLLTIQIKEKYIFNQDYINRFFEKWIRETIYYLCNQLIDRYLIKLNKYHLKKPELSIRNMTSRWGSCIPANNKIIISKNLIYPPFKCLEYVVLHELSHLIEPNHSQKFYNIIAEIMPDWKERKKVLNEF